MPTPVSTDTWAYYLQWLQPLRIPDSKPHKISHCDCYLFQGLLRVGSGRFGFGHGDPPLQRATVEMHPYSSEAPHLTDTTIYSTPQTYLEKNASAIYIRMAQVLHICFIHNKNINPTIYSGLTRVKGWGRPANNIFTYLPHNATSIVREMSCKPAKLERKIYMIWPETLCWSLYRIRELGQDPWRPLESSLLDLYLLFINHRFLQNSKISRELYPNYVTTAVEGWRSFSFLLFFFIRILIFAIPSWSCSIQQWLRSGSHSKTSTPIWMNLFSFSRQFQKATPYGFSGKW